MILSRLYKNQYSYSLLSKFSIAFFGFVGNIFINRFLGPSQKGEYTYLLNIITLVILILNLGVYQSYPYFKRNLEKNIKDKFISIFFMQFILYILIFSTIFILYPGYKDFVVFGMIPVSILSNQLNFLLMVENINLKNTLNIINIAFYTAALAFIFFTTKRNLIVILSLLCLKEIFQIFMYIFFFKLKLNLSNFNLGMLYRVIGFGIVPMLCYLLITLNYKVDVLILKRFVSYNQIGLYSVGVQMAEQAWLVTDSFKEVLFSKTAKNDSIEELSLSIKVNFYISIFMFVFILVFGKYIITALFGIEFVDSYLVTVIIFCGIIGMVFYKLIYTLFIAAGKRKLSFTILFFIVFINIILNFITIPKLGITGAALSSVISYNTCGLLFLISFKKLYHVRMSAMFLPKSDDFKRISSLLFSTRAAANI